MADYHSPTVVRPSIPASAITRLELVLLTGIFEHEPDGDAIYFYSSEGPSDTGWLDIADLKAMLEDEVMPSGCIVEIIRERLAAAGPDEIELELDLSDLGEAPILQCIVRRCAQLDHVAIVSAWTCTKMRPDGCVTVVTADHVLSSSTCEMESRLLDRADYRDLGCAPGHGSHVLLCLDEAQVRQPVSDIFEVDPLAGVSLASISDEDIRAACCTTAANTDLAEEHGNITFITALVAIDTARARAA